MTFITRAALAADLAAPGLNRGDVVMAHAGMRSVGPLLNGPDALIGAPQDTCTLIHLSEHRARIPGKRVLSYDVPFATADDMRWQRIEEFDTSEPCVCDYGDGLDAGAAEQ